MQAVSRAGNGAIPAWACQLDRSGIIERVGRRKGWLLAIAALILSGCGGSTKGVSVRQTVHASTPPVNDSRSAERPNAGQFPVAAGRSLQQLAGLATQSAQFGGATSTYTPGSNRLGFALIDRSNRFISAPTAVYFAASPGDPAQGPYLAPADPLGVPRQYRSAENGAPDDITAIYDATVRFPAARTYDVLTLTRAPAGLVGTTTQIKVGRGGAIPNVGQRAPRVATDTLATVHGDLKLLTTRQPPESMHSVSFSQVLGHRPVALLFSTPELCTSRVCGPVTDVVVSLQHEFAGRMTFIHEEVYVKNDPSKGLRPQLKAFGLHTEPWLFVVNSRGVISARLEGAFGVGEARRALESGLS